MQSLMNLQQIIHEVHEVYKLNKHPTFMLGKLQKVTLMSMATLQHSEQHFLHATLLIGVGSKTHTSYEVQLPHLHFACSLWTT